MMNQPKISVVTWNGGFRESFHTVDFFANQTFSKEEYDFTWVEYYSEVPQPLKEKIDSIPNGKILCLERDGQWHAGQCMNAGVQDREGELLVITDGDIAVEPDFLEQVWHIHEKYKNLVLYFRRWDELEEDHVPGKSQSSIEHLKLNCRLDNPTNYGGCITVRREVFDSVGGYEEHPIIGGPGAVSKELYTRLNNAGHPIMWHPSKKIYHPWHFGTLPSTNTPQQRKQAWVINQRALSIDTQANAQQLEEYLALFSDIQTNHSHSQKGILHNWRTNLKKFIKKIS